MSDYNINSGQISSLYIKEAKKIKKRTYTPDGHGSTENDPTNMFNVRLISNSIVERLLFTCNFYSQFLVLEAILDF